MNRTVGFGFLLLVLSGCGVLRYPGQPGLTTHGYAKIDVEFATDEGLYTYETKYDNSLNGRGVKRIVTLRYPNAKTFTSNVRSNADGSVYRTKKRYQGSVVDMIVNPEKQEVLLSPESKVIIFLESELSVDEVDDRNTNELAIFDSLSLLSRLGYKMQKFRWDLVRAASLQRDGKLLYKIKSLDFGGKVLEPKTLVTVYSNFNQSGFQISASEQEQQNLTRFIEKHYPKGFRGKVGVDVEGAKKPVVLPVGIHTRVTAVAAGYDVKENVPQTVLKRAIKEGE